jgi:hypothetical protein
MQMTREGVKQRGGCGVSERARVVVSLLWLLPAPVATAGAGAALASASSATLHALMPPRPPAPSQDR